MRSTTTVTPRGKRLTALAAAACGVVALTACSSSGSNDAASSTPPAGSSSAAMSSSAAPTSSAAPSSSVSSSSTSGSASGSASASSSSAASSSSPAVKVDPVAACTTATSKSNDAVNRWNKAVDTQISSQLDSAAANFRSTAKELRKLGPQAGDKGFVSKAGAVATDMESMATARTNRQTVSTSKFNTDSSALRSYCQDLITK